MTPRHIIVRGPNWTGDVIMATPGFRALRAGFPDARLVLHLRPGLEPLVAGAPWFDEVIPVESYHRGPAALAREAARLRGRRFDLGVCLPDSFSAALLLRLAGVPHCDSIVVFSSSSASGKGFALGTTWAVTRCGPP